ncbi:hypothetical protein RJ640_010641 [Escallonia rubra]|uniref:Uncharacterized protein n=1 Tax=Escallonia rubra TaxID=112253 RepID=A0AA88QIH1_9ASTE|nr:hypothetical protein RJ640_010641 [Escallonia rubra]
MGKIGLFDLEKHFAFYGAYHSNPVNIFIHMVFVWPILFTFLMLLHFTPPLFSLSQFGLGNNTVIVFNYGFLFTLVYALFYVLFDKKAGSVAALLCFACWLVSSSLGNYLGYSLAWKCPSFNLIGYIALDNYSAMGVEHVAVLFLVFKVVLAAQLICWTGQFLGHGLFEKRAPALLDNLAQAFLMAPFFVLLEVGFASFLTNLKNALQMLFNYEPYPGFHLNVKARVEANIKEWQEKKQKKIS